MPSSKLGNVEDPMLGPGMQPDLHDARAHTRHGFPVIGHEPGLDSAQLIAGERAGRHGKGPEIVEDGPGPEQRFVRHGLKYKYLYIVARVA